MNKHLTSLMYKFSSMDITPSIFISTLAMPIGTYDKVQGARDYSILCTQYIERFAHFDLNGGPARSYRFHFCLLGFQTSYTNEKEMKPKKVIRYHHCKNNFVKVTH